MGFIGFEFSFLWMNFGSGLCWIIHPHVQFTDYMDCTTNVISSLGHQPVELINNIMENIPVFTFIDMNDDINGINSYKWNFIIHM